MRRILAISSQVACGHVGLSAIAPAAQALGCQIIALPTIILSNHPGHPHVAGERIAPKVLANMRDAIEQNGWLAGVDVLLTGYLPTAGHVEFARQTAELLRRSAPSATIICDPVIGDETEGVYIENSAAEAIRDEMVPLADIILPNRFELSWLTGHPVQSIADAVTAAAALPGRSVLATSIPAEAPEGGQSLLHANVLTSSTGTTFSRFTLMDGVPKGTGDFLSGAYAADPDLARTTARTANLVAASIGLDHLAIAETAHNWRDASPEPAATWPEASR